MDKEQERFIKDNWNSMSAESLRKLVNEKFGTEYKTTAFHYHTNRMGLKKHIEHQYTAEEDEFLRANSPLMTREELTKEFNNRFGISIKQNTINMRCCLKGWSASNDGQFKKGSTPWSKTKGGRDEYVKTLKGGNSKSFKKGLIPHNTKAIGYERIESRNGKIRVKTSDGWKSKSQAAWEQVYGKVPSGMHIISVNGDINNTNVDELRIIDNATQILLMSNGWHKSGAEIFDTGVEYAKLYYLLKEKMGINRWDFRNRYALD